MAAAPVCFKMFYKDRIINIDQEVSIHRVRYTYVSYKSANRLRYVSANASEREKRSTFISRSSSKEKQLKSLDSYFGKSKEDNNNNNQYSPNSLNNDLITSTPNKEQITNPKKYLIKNEQAEVDDHRGLKSEYDESSGLYIISTMASINIAVYLFEIASPITNSDMELFSLPALYGAKINHLIVYGEWWRLLTPMFLHTGILHIGLDCWALLTFGPRVCRAYGPFTFLLIYLLGGLSGNLTSFLHTPEPTVGGTGPVFGIIGAWLIYQYQNKEAMGKDDFESMYQKAIVATALGFVLSTFGPIDDWTHFGSAFTGIAYGYLTCPTLQIDNSSSSTVESGKENGITLIQRNVNPCKSLVIFSIFISVLCCLFLIFEPPLGSLVVDTLV